MSIETVLRTIIREELSLDQAVRDKRAGWSAKSRLYALAQEIVDEVKPGETVQEVLINTNSAEPITEVIEQAKELLANAEKPQPAKKVVFTIMYNSAFTNSFPSTVLSPNRFETLKEAAEVVRRENENYPHYFILEHVEA